jgi:hypothetical protein
MSYSSHKGRLTGTANQIENMAHMLTHILGNYRKKLSNRSVRRYVNSTSDNKTRSSVCKHLSTNSAML